MNFYETNKTIIKFFDDTWSMNMLDLKDYSPENNRGYRDVSAVINNFNKLDWRVALKNKTSQSATKSLENI